MKSFRNFISDLQQQPYEVRLRILWGSVLVIGLVLIILWFFTLKQSISQLNSDELLALNPAAPTAPTAAEALVLVERAELSEQQEVLLFFKLSNPSADILNVSVLSEIELQLNGRTLHPLKIHDRQNQPFVQKVLSHTTAFGILIFPGFETAGGSGTLTFDNLFFEQKPEVLFADTQELDFNELLKSQPARN